MNLEKFERIQDLLCEIDDIASLAAMLSHGSLNDVSAHELRLDVVNRIIADLETLKRNLVKI